MRYYWNGFTGNDFADYCSRVENGTMETDWWVGNVRIGVLCFDLVTRCFDGENITLTYDLYIGGVDTGYGYTKSGYPYDFGDGGCFPDSCISMDYDSFREMAERLLTDYIMSNGYMEGAEAPLLLW